ncbi:CPBP family intramembrane glutamic endopeptidase [Enteractinococcus helveticum]|uniref:CAAX prenyl protease 2/Lysostaphin resistance protein A-like domain-containing protein n=1 Tax=Enteractinococcus helveticum TaxID=1837282 RepID=A0A1B7LX99_9MICC|nr:CPBP family intramembrane glutamic endopeptidase [Enteractinococcus helveticum]OAV59821.1 hypothetical protein A6F49_13710 [Enteractinococcus helveticum]
MVTSLTAVERVIAAYSLAVLPGLVLIMACFWLARTDTDPLLRIVMLVLGFILIRDGMTPAGLWDFGLVNGVVPWIRMTDNAAILMMLGAASLLLVALTLADKTLRALIWWGKFNLSTLALGIIGAILVVAPLFVLTAGQPLETRGGAVALSVIPALAFMTLCGNLFEEVLFRGYFQGRLLKAMSPARAAVLSGLFFAACHAYLATTVTEVGWPLLAFTLWEGLICAFLRMRRGVIPAALAHGLAIFLLSSGLI